MAGIHKLAGMSKVVCGATLALLCALTPARGLAQDDFLTREEVDAVRDAQEPEKRIPLFLEIAEIRLGSIRAAIASVKPGAGRNAQKKMTEYTQVLEALETSIAEAREKRSPFPKAMELLKTRLPAAKQFLESLDSEDSPLYADYEFTLEEAVDVTDELIEDIGKGMFPEVGERTSPKEFPAAPPRPEERRKPAPAAGEESGPPPKRGASAPPSEDGPPRKGARQ